MEQNLAELENQVREDPKMRRFYDLALQYQKSGKLDEAVSMCEAGLERNPTQWQARLLLAQLYAGKDRLDEAKTMAERVLMVLPDNVAANHLIADILFASGDKAEALRHYRIVQLFEPGRQQVEERIRMIAGGEESRTSSHTGAEPTTADARLRAPVEVDEGAEPEDVPLPAEPDPSETLQIGAHVAPGEEVGGSPESTLADDSSDVWDMPEVEDDSLALGGPELEQAGFLEPEAISADEGEVAVETDRMETLPPELSRDETEASWENGQSPEEATDPSLSTMTLAELYEKQGYPEKAIEIYQRILLKEPENASIRDKIGQLMSGMAGAEPESPAVQDEDVKKAVRKRRIETLEGWLRRIREGAHV